jgi:hypothetical protein
LAGLAGFWVFLVMIGLLESQRGPSGPLSMYCGVSQKLIRGFDPDYSGPERLHRLSC